MMDGRVMRKVAALQLGTCESNRLKKGVHWEMLQGRIKGMRQGYGRGNSGVVRMQ